jgi:tRNA G18 (ribose-2'-O)-methylase SpoU
MARVAIDNLDDPRIAVYRGLKASNLTRGLAQFVVEGERLVERLLASRFPVVSVLVTDRHLPRLDAKIPEGVPTYVISHEVIDGLVGFRFHRGVLACGQRQPWPPLQNIVDAGTGPFTLVICPKLSNPENLGTITRIADVFGVLAIVAGPECPDPFSRRVLRVSMGSVLQIPVVIEPAPGAAIDELVDSHQVELFGAVVDRRAEPFDGVPCPRRLGLVLGEEDHGIDPEWLARCRRLVTIPMRDGVGSLNVAVAAGILLHGLTRQDSSRHCPVATDGSSGSDPPPRAPA